jgi:general nucleoside transport system ATP-binding protein
MPVAAAVELRDIRKRFGPTIALDGVSLSLRPGRVHGLLGENGAGKSTLMNVLYGLLRADGGEIRIDGRHAAIRSPQDALAAGVGMVHQHFMLAGAMTVLDNVLLGDRRAGQWLDRGTAAGKLVELSRRLGLPVNLRARIAELSVGEQQRVEILKALYREVNVLILDEPTAVLTPAETEQLFAAVDRLRTEGTSVVFISHKLGEVKQICDEVTVLRRGWVVFEGAAAGVSAEELSRHMVGHDLAPVRLDRDSSTASDANLPALTLEGVSAGIVRDVSLRIGAGEILGIAGVDGNGQQELAEMIIGLRRATAGRIALGETDVTRLPLARRIDLGLAHIPNDRKREGLVGTMSIAENLALKRHAMRPFARGGLMSWRAVRRSARELVDRFDVRAPSIDSPVATLSGGNQQKVILARELGMADPKLVVAMNPARGLDVAATNFVYEQLLAVRRRGGAVLLISSELDELLELCDRIGVLYGGRFAMSDFPRTGAFEIGRMMTGTVAATAAGAA